MRNLTVTLVVAIALMGGFYVGFRYEKSKVPDATASPAGFAAAAGGTAGLGGTTGRGAVAASPGTGTGATGGGGAPGGGAGFVGRGTFGTVSSISDKTLTLKDAQGQDVKVTLQDSTTITKTVSGSQSDLAQGVTVTAAGQRDASGNVAATAITIVPAGAGGFGGGQRPAGG